MYSYNIRLIMYLACLICVVFFVQNIEGQDSCRPGWIRYHHSCYLFSRETLSWGEAELHCGIYGAKVAEIESAEEEGLIRLHLVDTYSSDSCRARWIRYHHSCYLFSREKLSWGEAEQHCGIYGAKVAEIESAEEERYIRLYLVDNYKSEVGLQGFWLGATDDQQEGHWIWIKDREPVGYSDWAPGEPNNKDSEENCLEYFKEQSFKWNDAPCRLRRRFICEEALNI